MTPGVHWRAAAFAAAFPDRAQHGAGFVCARNARDEETMYATWLGGQDYQNASKMYGAYPKGYLEGAMSLFPDARRILHLFSGSLTAAQVEAAWERGVEKDSDDLGPARKLVPPYPTQIRFDNALHPASAAAKPDVMGDAQNLAGLCEIVNATEFHTELNRTGALPVRGQRVLLGPDKQPFDVVFADPPYRIPDQRRYWREAMWSINAACDRCGWKADCHKARYRKSTREGALVCPDLGGGSGELQLPGYVRFKPLNKKLVIQQAASVIAPGGWLVWLDEIRPPYRRKEWVCRGSISIWRSCGHRLRGATLLERVAG